MLETFAILMLCQGIGELFGRLLHLPIPGPVLGMVLLFCLLRARPLLLARMEATANALLQHLSVLFVPAGVGIIAAFGMLKEHWLGILLSLLISTILTLVVTGLVARWMTDAESKRASGEAHE
ncbi:CidA/LrgA family protein [Kerstersia similis]|uniref:CidA/LrgA family protein n=1 Tax=Kerstersia similis TaxID=206505 RepID=UPI0039EFB12A